MLVSVWAILSRKQLVFEVAYFWVLAAATQAILTPDNSRWRLGEFDVFLNFLSHGVIMLNVLWLVCVDKMRCRPWSWLKVFLGTNLLMIPISLINLALSSNYFFICRKPGERAPSSSVIGPGISSGSRASGSSSSACSIYPCGGRDRTNGFGKSSLASA